METIVLLLVVFICVCYLGFGFTFTYFADSLRPQDEKFNFIQRILIVLLWPFLILFYLFFGYKIFSDY